MKIKKFWKHGELMPGHLENPDLRKQMNEIHEANVARRRVKEARKKLLAEGFSFDTFKGVIKNLRGTSR